MIYGLLSIVIIALCVKIYLMKKSIREIANEFADRLQTDTNTLIDISSRDRDMCRLADSINEQLKILRKEHLQYHQGNTELKNAITNISHDIRTPLTAIYGYLDMIQKTDDLQKQAKYISIMKDRAELLSLYPMRAKWKPRKFLSIRCLRRVLAVFILHSLIRVSLRKSALQKNVSFDRSTRRHCTGSFLIC